VSGYADQSIDLAESYVSLTKPVKHIDLISAIEQSIAEELDTTVSYLVVHNIQGRIQHSFVSLVFYSVK